MQRNLGIEVSLFSVHDLACPKLLAVVNQEGKLLCDALKGCTKLVSSVTCVF